MGKISNKPECSIALFDGIKTEKEIKAFVKSKVYDKLNGAVYEFQLTNKKLLAFEITPAGFKNDLNEVHRNYKQKLASFFVLDEILNNAVYLFSEADKYKRKEVVAIHKLQSEVIVDKELYDVLIIIFETTKTYLYDHILIKKAEHSVGILGLDKTSSQPITLNNPPKFSVDYSSTKFSITKVTNLMPTAKKGKSLSGPSEKKLSNLSSVIERFISIHETVVPVKFILDLLNDWNVAKRGLKLNKTSSLAIALKNMGRGLKKILAVMGDDETIFVTLKNVKKYEALLQKTPDGLGFLPSVFAAAAGKAIEVLVHKKISQNSLSGAKKPKAFTIQNRIAGKIKITAVQLKKTIESNQEYLDKLKLDPEVFIKSALQSAAFKKKGKDFVFNGKNFEIKIKSGALQSFTINKEMLSGAGETESILQKLIDLAEPFRFVRFSEKSFYTEFNQDGVVETPIGDIQLEYEQFEKIFKKNRENVFGLIKPTLIKPLVILPNWDEKQKESTAYVKTFINKEKNTIYFAGFVRTINKELKVISNHNISFNQLKGIIEKGYKHKLYECRKLGSTALNGFTKKPLPKFVLVTIGIPFQETKVTKSIPKTKSVAKSTTKNVAANGLGFVAAPLVLVCKMVFEMCVCNAY
jgi:hypothetical protein